MSAKRPVMKLWEYPRCSRLAGCSTLPVEEPLISPTLEKRTDFDVCLELFANPPTRAEAIESLVATFGSLSSYPLGEREVRTEEHRAAFRACWRDRTIDGTPVGLAMPTDLTVEAVGLAGWALDRQYRREHNQGGRAWIEAARAAYLPTHAQSKEAA